MYSRLLNKAPETIVHNGKINFGTFTGVSPKLDIRGVKAPFAGIPTARFFSNFRIKSKITYAFTVENYIGYVEFFDDKVFGLADVVFWNMETKQKFAYHTILGPRKRFVPVNTNEAVCSNWNNIRNIKITWNRKHNKIVLSFSVRGDKFKPAAKGKFISHFWEKEETELMTVNPSPTMQRCSATWFLPMNFNGGIGTAKHRRQIREIPQEKGQSLMLLNRTYYKLHLNSEFAFGFLTQNDKKISFSFSQTNQDALDEDEYNNNILTVDGRITAMPPVLITHPFGLNKNWIVQDTESMVDLTFTPVSTMSRTLSIIIMRNASTMIYGTFEGVLLSKDGEKIVLKNCPGFVKKNMLRL